MYALIKGRIYLGFSIFVTVLIGVVIFVLVRNKKDTQIIAQLQQDALHYYVDFDQSMQAHAYPEVLKRPDARYVYNAFRQLYERNSVRAIKPSAAPKIPKYIHVMWLGGALPDEYHPYVKSWRSYHPDWTIIFWTDNERNYNQGDVITKSFDDLARELKQAAHKNIVVDARDLLFDNRIFYDRARNYGEKSDILKWEIVYRFGGVYVDTDFECLRPLDLFNHLYDFYTGIQPLDTNLAQLGAALFAACPKHPILERCVSTIKNNQHIQQIIVKTGPIHFTKVFLETAGKTDGLIDVALPASYFYPCSYEQKGMKRDMWCRAESFAVHHWAGSWLKPEAFIRI